MKESDFSPGVLNCVRKLHGKNFTRGTIEKKWEIMQLDNIYPQMFGITSTIVVFSFCYPKEETMNTKSVFWKQK